MDGFEAAAGRSAAYRHERCGLRPRTSGPSGANGPANGHLPDRNGTQPPAQGHRQEGAVGKRVRKTANGPTGSSISTADRGISNMKMRLTKPESCWPC